METPSSASSTPTTTETQEEKKKFTWSVIIEESDCNGHCEAGTYDTRKDAVDCANIYRAYLSVQNKEDGYPSDLESPMSVYVEKDDPPIETTMTKRKRVKEGKQEEEVPEPPEGWTDWGEVYNIKNFHLKVIRRLNIPMKKYKKRCKDLGIYVHL